MRVFVHMVVRNEADRWFQSVLQHLRTFYRVAIHVYDDGSDDLTPKVAELYGARVGRRPPGVPTFMVHEGQFRQAAWADFEERMAPTEDDWVLALDADEFPVAPFWDHTLRFAIEAAKMNEALSVTLPIPEVFGAAVCDGDQVPAIRTDGFWGKLSHPRLFAYRRGGRFSSREMGCGSEPTYVHDAPTSMASFDLALLHFGYFSEEDREAKYRRFRERGAHGHNPAHIESILTSRVLKAWDGNVPEVWQGLDLVGRPYTYRHNAMEDEPAGG